MRPGGASCRRALQKFQPLVKLSGNFSETPARIWRLGAPGPLR
jgi:hypothetical protein